MDEFDIPEEKVTSFLRAVQAPTAETLPRGSRSAKSNICASLLAVSHPHALAVAALGDKLTAVRLDRSATFGTTVSATLTAPALAVLCPPSNPGVVIVLLDEHRASTAIRVYDLHALLERSELVDVCGYHLYARDDEEARIVSIQVADMGWAVKASELYLCVAFDNGNAGVYRLGGADSPMASLKIHAASSALPGSAATCIAVVPPGVSAEYSAVAVGTEQGKVLLYSVTNSGAVKLTGTFSELISGWAPRYLYTLSRHDILVVYKDEENSVRNAVISLDAGGLLLTDGPNSAAHLGELCWPSYEAPDDQLPLFMAAPIPTWPLVIVASSKSSDVELLGRTDEGLDDEGSGAGESREGWRIWKPDEGCCMVMPGDDDDKETFPIGIALNLANTTPVPAANEKEAPLKPMPRVLVLSSIGTLIEYTVADDRPGATCEAIEEKLPLLAPVARVLSNESEAAASLSASSSVPASTVTKTPLLSPTQDISAASSFHAASRIRQRPTSVGSRSEVEVTDSSSEDSGDDENSLDDSVSPPAHVQSLSVSGFVADDANEVSDTGNRESSSNDYDGEVDTDDDNTGQNGFQPGRGGLGMDETRAGRPRVPSRAPFVGTGQFKPLSFAPSPTQPPPVVINMEKRMKSNLTPAIQAARDPDPIAQLRSALLEMQEEITAVSQVSEGMHFVLEDARGQIASELDNVSVRILELRSSVHNSVKKQEQRHSVASQCMKDAISIGRDLEAVTLLFRTNGGKQGLQRQGLSSDVVLVDERLDQKQSEVSRALSSIEEKLERPIRNSRASIGGRDARRTHASAYGEHVDTCQQVFSSLSLQGARIKRVLAMLGAMESQLNDHRRMLRGHIGSDIGLSQARLEKLSLSGSQQSRRPRGDSVRSTMHGVADSTTSKGTMGMTRVATALADCEQKPAPLAGQNQLSADACRALRDIAMRGGRERIQVLACNTASPQAEDKVEAKRANSHLLNADHATASVFSPAVPMKDAIRGKPNSSAFAAFSSSTPPVSSSTPPVSSSNPSARRGSGGTFTSTHLVRSGGQAYVGDSEPQQASQSRGNSRMRSREPDPAFGQSGGSAPRAFRQHASDAVDDSSATKGAFSFGVKQPSESASFGQSKQPGVFSVASGSIGASFGDKSSKEVSSSFNFGNFPKSEKNVYPFATPSEGSKGNQWGLSGADSAVGGPFRKVEKADERVPSIPSGFGGSRFEAAGKEESPFVSSISASVKNDSNLFAGPGKINAATTALPPLGSENDIVSSASKPPVASRIDFAVRGPAVGLSPAPLPPSGSENDAVPAPKSPVVVSKSGTFPSASLPPSGSERDVIPTAALPPSGSETDSVPSAALPPPGSESDSVPKSQFSPLITPSTIAATKAALPPDGSEKDVVPAASLPPSGSENDAVPKASLPPAGTENDYVPAHLKAQDTAKSSFSFGELPSSTQGNSSNFAFSSPPPKQPEIAAGSMPPDGSENDVVTTFAIPASKQDVPSAGLASSTPNNESSAALSLSAMNFGQQAAGANADNIGEKSSFGGTSNLFPPAKSLGESASTELPFSGASFGTLGLGGGTATSSSTGGGAIFGASALAANSASSGAVVAFGGPTALGQSSETPTKLSPSPFASTSMDGSKLANPQGFGSSFSSDPVQSFETTPTPAVGTSASTPPNLGTAASTAGFQASSASGFGTSTGFNAASAASTQFGAPSGFGVSPQQAQPTMGSAAFGSSVPSASFGAQSGFGAAPQSASAFGTPVQPATTFGGSAQPAATFGATSAFGFGQSVITSTSAFGQPSAFGQSGTTSASPPSMGMAGFGAGGTGLQQQSFGVPAAATPPLFGSAAAGTSTGFAALASQSSSAFGASPFGQGSPAPVGGGFGGAAPSMGGFGTPQAAPQGGGFGQSAFGQLGSNNAVGFGQQPSPASDASFTSPAFTQRRG